MGMRLSFIKDVATLASGTAVAQLIALLAMPMITRLYTQEDFGNFAAFSSTVAILTVIAAGRYDQAVMLPNSEYGARIIVGLSLWLSFATCGVALIVFFVGYHWFDAIYNVSLGPFWILVPFAALLGALLQLANMLANRHGAFRLIATTRTARAIGRAVTQILVAVVGAASGLGLILGELAGLLVALAGNTNGLKKIENDSVSKRKVKMFKVRALRAAAHRYIQFPAVNAPHALINQSQKWVTTLIIGMLFSSRELGAYFLMFQVVMLPASLVGAAVGQVYYRQATHAVKRQGQLYRLVWQMVLILTGCGILAAAVFFVAGEPLFALVFGDEWRRAGHLASIFAPYVAVHFVLQPLASTPIVTGYQKEAFMLTAIQNVVFVLSFGVGTQTIGGIEGGLGAVSVLSSLYLIMMIMWNLKIARQVSYSTRLSKI